ncbi:hypothetical protein HDU98_009924 [Podochytrium sp. JEL0797]|nr:hypothetical protein HDU98_009924 [Podochytrium sp. JEL0797]
MLGSADNTTDLLALQQRNALLRTQVVSLEGRRHLVAWGADLGEAEFERLVGLPRGLFFSLCVALGPSLDKGRSVSNAFGLDVASQLAVLLRHLHACKNQQARKPQLLRGTLNAAVLRNVACAIKDVVYGRPQEDALNPTFLAVERILGISFATIHATLPKEKSVMSADTTLSDLLQVDESVWPKRLRKVSTAPPTDRFRWLPSFSNHPVFVEKQLVNMHSINKRAALIDENECLAFFADVMKFRHKNVRFQDSVIYVRGDDAWRRRWGVGKDVFAWLMAVLVEELTPKKSEVDSLVYFSAETKLLLFLAFLNCDPPKSRDAIDYLLVAKLETSITREEFTAVIQQVRLAMATTIYTTE